MRAIQVIGTAQPMPGTSTLIDAPKGFRLCRVKLKARPNQSRSCNGSRLSGQVLRDIVRQETCGAYVFIEHRRHTTAMHLLQSGVDISVIALWLGHREY